MSAEQTLGTKKYWQPCVTGSGSLYCSAVIVPAVGKWPGSLVVVPTTFEGSCGHAA